MFSSICFLNIKKNEMLIVGKFVLQLAKGSKDCEILAVLALHCYVLVTE